MGDLLDQRGDAIRRVRQVRRRGYDVALLDPQAVGDAFIRRGAQEDRHYPAVGFVAAGPGDRVGNLFLRVECKLGLGGYQYHRHARVL